MEFHDGTPIGADEERLRPGRGRDRRSSGLPDRTKLVFRAIPKQPEFGQLAVKVV